jgi:hypothetical protein
MADLVLISQAAQESTYTPEHISYLLRKGLVKGEKQGGIWLVDLADLRRYEGRMASLGSKKFDPTRGKSGAS